MHNKLVAACVVLMFAVVSYSTAGVHTTTVNEISVVDDSLYDSVMRLDAETKQRWEQEYSQAERVSIEPGLAAEIQATEDFSILDLLEYVPEERNQGYCPNCWAWPATGILGIALNVQQGIRDRLSVQYINTCGEEYNLYPRIECCEGGNINMFTAFYRATERAIPWSNRNADWHDGGLIRCNTPCDSIAKSPNYPISGIRARTIDIHNLPEETVINNIKNVLHQDRGVYFSIFYPDAADLRNFNEFWSNRDSDYVYDLDYYCGHEWVEEEAAGHAVLCVGYHDDEETDSNDYWIMLNSWGTTDGRPQGLFRVDMHMNYDCQYSNYYAFGAETLNVTFKTDMEAPEAPSIAGPSSGKARTRYTYTVSAIDPQGDDVSLFVDWGDGSDSGWVGPVASGEEIELTHWWLRRGDYTITVQAKDIEDRESAWSTLPVSMPYTRQMFLERILDWLIDLLFPPC